jgi:hypothetical protein
LNQLDRLIWEKAPEPDSLGAEGLSAVDLLEMLQSKAVECEAFVRSPRADSLVLHVIRSHPSEAVRAAAIDAYLFNHGDTPATKEQLRRILSGDDRPAVDKVRRADARSPAAFDSSLTRFYRLHPDQVAPAPGPGHPRNVSDSVRAERSQRPPVRPRSLTAPKR